MIDDKLAVYGSDCDDHLEQVIFGFSIAERKLHTKPSIGQSTHKVKRTDLAQQFLSLSTELKFIKLFRTRYDQLIARKLVQLIESLVEL